MFDPMIALVRWLLIALLPGLFLPAAGELRLCVDFLTLGSHSFAAAAAAAEPCADCCAPPAPIRRSEADLASSCGCCIDVGLERREPALECGHSFGAAVPPPAHLRDSHPPAPEQVRGRSTPLEASRGPPSEVATRTTVLRC
jgi:hypothetical protein